MIFFFNDTATTEIYTLSLHDALPILPAPDRQGIVAQGPVVGIEHEGWAGLRPDDRLDVNRHSTSSGRERLIPLRFILQRDRKSTRLNSSHANISYAVFCLKKKN